MAAGRHHQFLTDLISKGNLIYNETIGGYGQKLKEQGGKTEDQLNGQLK